MFRNDVQACHAIKVLLDTVSMGKLWCERGPSAEGLKLLAADGGYLSSGERVMLLAAFAIWNGSGELRIAQVISTLDEKPALALFTLIVSMKRGASDVDHWLSVYEAKSQGKPRGPPSSPSLN